MRRPPIVRTPTTAKSTSICYVTRTSLDALFALAGSNTVDGAGEAEAEVSIDSDVEVGGIATTTTTRPEAF